MWPLGKPLNPPADLLLHTNRPIAILVKFCNNDDSVTRAARILWVPTMRSRDILLHAKGDHLDQVHLDETVLEKIKLGRLVQ